MVLGVVGDAGEEKIWDLIVGPRWVPGFGLYLARLCKKPRLPYNQDNQQTRRASPLIHTRPRPATLSESPSITKVIWS